MNAPTVNWNDESLLLTREMTYLKEVRGISVPFKGRSDDCFPSKPLMKCMFEPEVLSGTKSGLRSALIKVKNKTSGKKELVFIKGCGYEDKGIDSTNEHSGEPLGGQSLSCANSELRFTKKVNDILEDYEFKPVRIPLGRFDYESINFDGEPCSASVYKANGDTRLDEFFNYLMAYALYPKNRDRKGKLLGDIENVVSHIAKYCGNLIRVLHGNGYLWGSSLYDDGTFMSNAHIGNFVIFPDNGDRHNFRIGIVDFDSQNIDSSKIKNKEKLLVIMTLEIKSLIDTFAIGKPISNPGYEVRDGKIEGMPPELVKVFIDSLMNGLFGDVRSELINVDAFGLLDKVIPRIVVDEKLDEKWEYPNFYDRYNINYINDYFSRNNIHNIYDSIPDVYGLKENKNSYISYLYGSKLREYNPYDDFIGNLYRI